MPMNPRSPRFVLVSPKNRTVYNFRGDLLREVAKAGCEAVVTGPNQVDADRIEALGARFCEIPLAKDGINPREDLSYLFRLWRLFRSERPKVVLGYTVKPVVYGSIAAKLAGVPHVTVMVTGLGYTFTATTRKARILREVVKMLYRVALLCADTVIFQNPDDRDEFVAARLVAARKTRIVNGSGVNLARYPASTTPTILTFFMLARVLRSKGIQEYLEAARKVKAEFPEVRFMLLGAVEEQADSLGHDFLEPYLRDGTVEHFGETHDVAHFYRQCSVFVLPSYREGTPRTVLEAMSMARPVITTDVPGCRQTVVEGVNGFLVPPRDVEALAERMAWFARHPESIASMGQASRELCAEKFDVAKVNADMMRHLKMAPRAKELEWP